jgi:hypothetical protein
MVLDRRCMPLIQLVGLSYIDTVRWLGATLRDNRW